MTYGLMTRKGYIKSEEIVARLDPSIAIQNAHIQAIRDLEAEGCGYSNEDYDVLSAALSAVGRTEVRDFESAWVFKMNQKVPR